MTSYILYGLVIVLLMISAILDMSKTKKAIKIGFNSFKKLMPAIVPMMIFIGIILAVLSPGTISLILGEQSGAFGVLLGLIIGSIAFMPSFVAFPLGANLLTHGAGKVLVDTYYKYSPPLAEIIQESTTLRFFVRLFLSPVLFLVVFPYLSFTLTAILLLAGLMVRYRISKRKSL